MRWMLGAVAALLLCPQLASAESKYIYTNHRLDYVKLQPIPKKESAEKSPTHPATIAIGKMQEILASLKVSRKLFLRKQVETQEIFNEKAVGFLAPLLVEAFQRAGADEVVVFSYLWKNPQLIMRNDRFTAAKAWVKDQELHIEFLKLHAKLEGDTDKKGNFDRVVNQAKSLRIELEPQAGQMFGASNAHELVIDLAAAVARPVPEGGAKGKAAASRATIPATEPVDTSLQSRLRELDTLRRARLITDDEYQAKRKALLQNL